MKRKVVCLPGAMLPKDLDPDVEYFSIYSHFPLLQIRRLTALLVRMDGRERSL